MLRMIRRKEIKRTTWMRDSITTQPSAPRGAKLGRILSHRQWWTIASLATACFSQSTSYILGNTVLLCQIDLVHVFGAVSII